MFTGIIESIGVVEEVITSGSNRSFWIRSSLTSSFKVDQSLAHNGVCLTIEELGAERYRVTAVAETLQKTEAGQWTPGRSLNLERSLLPSSRLDGHFVQGHVDTTGTCEAIVDRNGSHEFSFSFPPQFAHLVIEKGSISINGISLTVWNVQNDRFKVAVIPYTFNHTNLQYLQPGDAVNIEFDLLGKYIHRKLELAS